MKMLLIIGVLAILAVLALVTFLALKKPKPVDKSLATYTGKIEDYSGSKRLIVVFTASWASVWKVTAEALKQVDRARFDLSIVDDTDRATINKYGVTILPTVALIQNGRITKSVPNLTTIDQIKDW